jgi:cytochrome c biogenesis protein CcdA
MSGIGPLVVLLVYAVGLAILYWVIRLAVRHAIKDADDRRARPHL